VWSDPDARSTLLEKLKLGNLDLNGLHAKREDFARIQARREADVLNLEALCPGGKPGAGGMCWPAPPR
jgi:hypothetical protein